MLQTIANLLVATALAMTASTTLPIELKQEVGVERKAELTETEEVVKTIKDVFGRNADLFIKISRCESSLRQTDDKTGVVKRGPTDDLGALQINEFWHRKEAEKLGLDINKLEDNIKYGRILFDKHGLIPWDASKHCWIK